MNRRFNSTGRVKIPRDAVVIRLTTDGSDGPGKFTADLSGLETLGLDASGRVIIEPYVRQSRMRFDFGTVGSIEPPADAILSEIDRGESVQFRVKVVDTAGRPGRLIAMADQIRPVDEADDNDRKSILPLKFTDLGEAVWRIDVAADESPELLVNSRIVDIGDRLATDVLLRGAIFPVAIREVLRAVLSEESDADRDWVKDWRRFAESLLREPLPDDTLDAETAKDLIERVVEAFCNREKWATRARPVDQPVEADYE